MTPRIIPVIHYSNEEQAMRNAQRAFEAGCDGVFLIHMNAHDHLLGPVARRIKETWSDRLVGTNLLGMTAGEALAMNLANGLDMTWTDDQLTHSALEPWGEAAEVRATATLHPEHLVFVGVAFKHQRHEPHPKGAAVRALEHGFIPTTSGAATGVAADDVRIAELAVALPRPARLAIASGVTPENASLFAPHLGYVLVATGVSSSFHEFDPALLRALMVATGR